MEFRDLFQFLVVISTISKLSSSLNQSLSNKEEWVWSTEPAPSNLSFKTTFGNRTSFDTVLTLNNASNPELHFIFKRGLNLNLNKKTGTILRRDYTGWTQSWPIQAVMNHYGIGTGSGGVSGNGWTGTTAPSIMSQGQQIAQIVSGKAKLIAQVLDLKRVTTVNVLNTLSYLSKLKLATIPTPHPTQDHPHQHYPVVTQTPGWQSTFVSTPLTTYGEYIPPHQHPIPVEPGSGWGWSESKGRLWHNIGYNLGSGIGKFKKFVGIKNVRPGWTDQTVNQWLTTGSGYVPTSTIGSQGHHHHHHFLNYHSGGSPVLSNSLESPNRPNLPGSLRHSGNSSFTNSNMNGFGYHYGNGNEYSSGFKDNNGPTFPSGSGRFMDGNNGGKDISTVLTVPEFKPLSNDIDM